METVHPYALFCTGIKGEIPDFIAYGHFSEKGDLTGTISSDLENLIRWDLSRRERTPSLQYTEELDTTVEKGRKKLKPRRLNTVEAIAYRTLCEQYDIPLTDWPLRAPF